MSHNFQLHRCQRRWRRWKWTSCTASLSRKKNKVYIITFVDRATRCIVRWEVNWAVSDEELQELLDGAPPAQWYYSDALPAYQELAYDTGFHFPMYNKSQTYSVEADNSELRHYLARLVRRSRCFSRCIDALRIA